MCLLLFLPVLYLPPTEPTGVDINGIIDFGQNWNFRYSIDPNIFVAFDPDKRILRIGADENAATKTTAKKEEVRKRKKKKTTSTPPAETTTKEIETTTQEITTTTQEIQTSDPPLEETTEIKKKKMVRRKRKKKTTLETLEIPITDLPTQSLTPIPLLPEKTVGIMALQMTPPANGNALLDLLSRFGINFSPTFPKETRVQTTTITYNEPFTAQHKVESEVTNDVQYPKKVLLRDSPMANNAGSVTKEDSVWYRPHYVKEDVRLQNFSLHVFKQSMDVLESIKSKVESPKIKKKLDYIARSYRDKFALFVNETLNQKIITKLGTQKVILNTIETSHRIMKRLLTYLVSDMEKKGVLRTHQGFAHALRNGLRNDEQQEYVHACLTFNVCRSRKTFSGFVVDVISSILQANDERLKQAMDALTEVVKNYEMSKFLDKQVTRDLITDIELIERLDANMVRPMMWMLRNLIASKNKPLIVQNSMNAAIVNKSVAIIDLVDVLDDKIQANEENVLDWNDIRESLAQWSEGKRTDILEIMQRFTWQVFNKGLAKMNARNAAIVHEKLKTIL